MSNKDALHYHAQPTPGKLEIAITKPLVDQKDLNLAYTPGIGAPCLAISKNPEDVYRYTAKGNLVAIISNGTAVLGLGDIGPEASKPVMEGKAVLMKKLAGVDAFDLEIDEKNIERLTAIIKAISPTFGAINLEDIKAPGCFELEKNLADSLSIPVMHDDQHITAIVVAAALKNACRLVKKELKELRVVINGAGAGAIASANLLETIGVKRSNMVMFDSKGVIHKNRASLPPHKLAFATDRPVTSLAEALKDADFFLGLSVADVLKPAHLRSMASDPIVFALANPVPEIDPATAWATRSDLILGTGRSDYPNQVNNVLGFPFIFRGLLDVRASQLNDAIKLAAIDAIANIVYNPTQKFTEESLALAKKNLVPHALDPRLLTSVAPAVAKAAIESGVAAKGVDNWELYRQSLLARVGRAL